MGFEIVEKRTLHGKIMQPNALSVKKTGFYLGETISDYLSSNGSYVEIYLDYDNKRVGLKPTKSKVTGFSLGKGYRKKRNIATSISNRIPHGVYEAVFDQVQGMFIITVPEIARQ